jgi:CO/xanthine dehydrogenase FAD-binding subunit
MAGLAVSAHREGARLAAVRLAFCGVEAAPRRLPEIEAALYARIDPAPLLARLLEPLGSAETPAGYRLHLAQVLARRAMETLHAAA